MPEPVRHAELLLDAFTAVATAAEEAEPWCVVHGDPHAANLFLDGDGRPALADWQLVQRVPFRAVG